MSDASAMAGLTRAINNFGHTAKDLVRILEALNANIVEIGRRLPKEEVTNAPE